MVTGLQEHKSASSLERARHAYAARQWADAFARFCEADAQAPLGAGDLESLVWSAALSARDDAMLSALERLYELHAAAGRREKASRCAFWLGFRNYSLGETGRAMAWMQRSQRLVDELGGESVVRGYLLLPAVHKCRAEGKLDSAAETAARAVAIGEKFHDRDLVGLARNLQGTVFIHMGRVAEGVALLDEAMLAASGGELSPLVTGLVYCSVISACCQIYAMDRAREWTDALSSWCDEQPQLGAFNGSCMVHRSEIMQMNGAWPEALQEARHASRHLEKTVDRDTAAAAQYQEGEIYRLRGDFAAAERCYRETNRLGREPYPGLALLRLAQGRREQAVAAIRRVAAATANPLARAKYLPAAVEIMLACGLVEEAAEASEQLDEISRKFGTEVLNAISSCARGLVASARGDLGTALPLLRNAFSTWHKVGAPYIAARIRAQIARACLTLGDRETAMMELEAARAAFEDVGAAPDLAEIAKIDPSRPREQDDHGLSAREVEVLSHLVSGSTNRAIADALGLSTKTVDRHVGNIFNKLGVSSRAAATARALRDEII